MIKKSILKLALFKSLKACKCIDAKCKEDMFSNVNVFYNNELVMRLKNKRKLFFIHRMIPFFKTFLQDKKIHS